MIYCHRFFRLLFFFGTSKNAKQVQFLFFKFKIQYQMWIFACENISGEYTEIFSNLRQSKYHSRFSFLCLNSHAS